VGRPERSLDPQSGPVQRFAWELRKLREKAGSPSYRQLSRKAHFSSTALSEAAGGSQLPTLAVTLGYVEACDGDIELWERQWREVAGEVFTPESQTAPYAGLAAFQPQDAELFKGREELVAHLVDEVGRRPFLGVFGASGSGKSSLLRAGLVPALPGRSVVLTPTANPLRELRERTAERPDLLVVDQFEETFTLCEDDGERTRFVAALLEFKVVIGCRVDFLDRCAAMPALVAALRDAQVLVGPMTADELRRAIVEPAAAMGVKAEPEMVAAAIIDAHGRPGALPLLSHALLETWRRRENHRLTLAGYRASGGVSGAIAATAEHMFTELSPDGQAAARSLLLRLVQTSHGEHDLRRRVALDEVLADTALNALVAARLVVVADGGVELAHEALTRAWPRLRAWIEEDRERLQLHQDLTTAALAWAAVGKDPGALYRGVRLAAARDLVEDSPVRCNELEREFLAASVAHDTAERATAKRQAHRLRNLVKALAVLLVACLVITIAAVLQRQEAVAEQRVAQSRQLALQAQDLSETWPDAAEVLAVSAFRTSPTTEARGALLSTAAYKPPRALLKDHRGAVRAVAFSPDGTLLASAGNDRSVLVGDPFSGVPPIALTQHQGTVRALAFDPAAPLLASAGDDERIVLWDLGTRAPAQIIPVPHGRVNSLAFSGDGRVLLSASQDGTVILWEGATEVARIPHDLGEINDLALSGDLVALAGQDGVLLYNRADGTRQTFHDHRGAVLSVALSRDGRALASGGADSQVVLRAGGEPSFLRRHTAGIRAVEFSPDGRELMSAADDGSVRWWSVPDGGWLTGLISRTGAFFAAGLSPDGLRLAAGGDDSVSVWQVALPPFTGHVVPPFSVAMAADGRMATGGADRSIMVWGGDGLRVAELTAPATVKSVAFHPNGTLLSAGEDGAVSVWDLTTRAVVRRIPVHDGPVTGFAMTPRGDLAATGGNDHTIRLFDPANGTPVRTLPVEHTAAVEALAFSPDGTVLASGGADGRIILWDVEHDRELALVGERGNALRGMAFTPDGGTLITGDASGAIMVWDVRARSEIGTLPGQRGAVREIALSGDGRTLAVAGSDTTITLWDMTTRTQLTSLTGHSGPVNAVAFGGPRGDWLASTGADPRVIRWDLDANSVIARICGRSVGRC
jgi:WD40 repeat protein